MSGDPAVFAPPLSAAWLSLSRLAGILRDVHGLRACVIVADDGAPELYVTGEAGTATVLAGSVHYWWSGGEGPIGAVGQAGAAAEKVAAGCRRAPALGVKEA